MKTLIKIILISVITLPVWAQDQDGDLPQAQNPRVRDKIMAARIAYITDQLQLTPDESEKFWPIYREFLQQRTTLQKQYREAKKNPDLTKTTEQNDKDLLALRFKIKQQELDLEKEYSGRLLGVISAQKLQTLPEAEKRFRQLILNQIQRKQMQPERRQNMKDRPQQGVEERNN